MPYRLEDNSSYQKTIVFSGDNTQTPTQFQHFSFSPALELFRGCERREDEKKRNPVRRQRKKNK